MIDLSPQPATYPIDAIYGVLGEVFDRVQDTIDDEATPPDLETSINAMRRHQRQDAAAHLDRALGDVAHAAVHQLVKLRAAIDPRATGR